MLVAAASSTVVDGGGRPAGDSTATTLPGWFSSYLYTFTLVGGFFVLLLGALLMRREQMNEGVARRSGALRSIALLSTAFALLVLAVRYPDDVSEVFERLSPRGLDPGEVDGGARVARTPELEWLAVAGASALVVAAATTALLFPIVRRRLRRRNEEKVAEVLAAALDETLDDLRAEADARRAIIRAYARMESVLDSCGLPRRESEAPLEYLARVLLELDVSPEPVETLTDLFERAKFSNHDLDARLKERAIEALELVRADLRELT
jgi:hypothetical protein